MSKGTEKERDMRTPPGKRCWPGREGEAAFPLLETLPALGPSLSG